MMHAQPTALFLEWPALLASFTVADGARINAVAAGTLMVLVGMGAALLANRLWRIEWRWLACGAMLWAVAVGEKIGLDCTINLPALQALERLPRALYLILGSSYIGLQTGYTEVAVTLVAGLIWRQLTRDARRAVAIGMGAGVLEAVLFGLLGAAGVISITPFRMFPDTLSATAILVPPVERLVVIPIHTVTRTLALYAVATRRWRWFWAGFVYWSVVDGLCGFYRLSTGSAMRPWYFPWLVQISFALFAVMAIPIVQYLWRHWPAATSSIPVPVPASLAVDTEAGRLA